MAGLCEQGNEPLGSIKAGNCLKAECLLASQKGLSSMELVIHYYTFFWENHSATL
jgi:hypothetical protein